MSLRTAIVHHVIANQSADWFAMTWWTGDCHAYNALVRNDVFFLTQLQKNPPLS